VIVGTKASIFFPLMSTLRESIRERNGAKQMTALQSAGVGALSRAAATVALNPISIVKTRIEGANPLIQQESKRGMASELGRLVRGEGRSSLWKGLLPSLVRDCPHSAIHLMVYNALVTGGAGTGGASNGLQLPNWCSNVPVASLVGTTIATLVTHPADVMRTRAQFFFDIVDAKKRLSYRETARTLWAAGGIKAFYSGALLRLVRKGATAAITFTLFEALISRKTTDQFGR
jgi:hypothetical protein